MAAPTLHELDAQAYVNAYGREKALEIAAGMCKRFGQDAAYGDKVAERALARWEKISQAIESQAAR